MNEALRCLDDSGELATVRPRNRQLWLLEGILDSDAGKAAAYVASTENPLDPGDLVLRRTRSEMIITANYRQDIDLKVYQYVYEFGIDERAPLF